MLLKIQYSDKYFDDIYEYKHVMLPSEVAKLLPKNRLLFGNEWRAITVYQSRGWVHYAIHRPEPHIMLFRRPLNYQQKSAATAAGVQHMAIAKQACTERQYPPAEVAQILDSAITSLQPCCSQNLPIYREVEMCMGIIKNQMLALIPTPATALPSEAPVV